jgi:hypothetical protein
MATIEGVFTYVFDFGAASILQPQGRTWVSFGPLDVFEGNAVVITAHPEISDGEGHNNIVFLQVTDTFVHVYPDLSSSLHNVLQATHLGAWILNTGATAIRYVIVKVAVIKA